MDILHADVTICIYMYMGFYLLFFLSDYKQTSLANYVKLFDQFLDAMARSRKGQMLKKSGMLPK